MLDQFNNKIAEIEGKKAANTEKESQLNNEIKDLEAKRRVKLSKKSL